MKSIKQIIEDNRNKECYLVEKIDNGCVEKEKIYNIYKDSTKFDIEIKYELEKERGIKYGWWIDCIEVLSNNKIKLDDFLYIEWEEKNDKDLNINSREYITNKDLDMDTIAKLLIDNYNSDNMGKLFANIYDSLDNEDLQVLNLTELPIKNIEEMICASIYSAINRGYSKKEISKVVAESFEDCNL